MDFADESYVRLYPRKTLTHKLLGWEGRAVMHAMLGEFDPAGIFAIRGDAAWCVSAVTDIPEDVARTGLKRLVDTETWVVTASVITWPSYEHAQNCSRSDRLRQREHRARRSLDAVTIRDPLSQPVTSGHAKSQLSQNVTLPPSAPSLCSLPHPPIAPQGARTRSRARKVESTLPVDWEPTSTHRAYASEHGLDLQIEVDAFRGWAEGRTTVSWNGTFSTRLANARRWGKPQRNGGRADRVSALIARANAMEDQ